MLRFRKATREELNSHDIGQQAKTPLDFEVIIGDYIMLEIEGTKEILQAKVLDVRAQVDHEYLKHVYYVCQADKLLNGGQARLEDLRVELGDEFQVMSIYRIGHARPS